MYSTGTPEAASRERTQMKSALKVLQMCSKSGPRVVQKSSNRAPKVLQKGSNCVPNVFQMCFKSDIASGTCSAAVLSTG
eukprot:8407872-Heterocapsa_arctica.AAC.1